MTWKVEITDDFINWWNTLDDGSRVDVDASITLLEELGPHLGFPHCSGINAVRFSHMRELRVQSKGRPIRILYAFDPRRIALLLLGGDKAGNKQWYKKNIVLAEKLYAKHLNELGELK